jgi:hypothetical protein
VLVYSFLFLAACTIISSNRAHDLTQGLGYARSVPRGVNLPEDVVKREANRAHNEKMWARKQKGQAWSATRRAARERGEDIPTEPGSSGEEEEEGEVASLPLFPS